MKITDEAVEAVASFLATANGFEANDDALYAMWARQALEAALPHLSAGVKPLKQIMSEEIQRLRLYHRSDFMSDVGRRDMLDHFERILSAIEGASHD